MSLRGSELLLTDASLMPPLSIPLSKIASVQTTGTCLDLSVALGTYRLAFESHDECELWMGLLTSQGVTCIEFDNERSTKQAHHVESPAAAGLLS